MEDLVCHFLIETSEATTAERGWMFHYFFYLLPTNQ